MDADLARAFLHSHHRAVLATTRADGRPQLSPVVCAVGLVAYYRQISGEHPDWDDYRAAMVRDRRVIAAIDITRAGPDISG